MTGADGRGAPPRGVAAPRPRRRRQGGARRGARHALLALATTLVGAAAAVASSVGPPVGAASELVAIDGAASCCAPAERVDGPPPADAVAIVGDSLTVGVTSPAHLGGDTLQARLRALGRPVPLVDARIGRRLAEGIEVIEANPRAIGEAGVVLVGLGTNDLWGLAASSTERAVAEIERVGRAIGSIDPGAAIVWVDLSVETEPARTATFNRALALVAARDPRVHVCGWRDLALARPGTFARDGIHLTRDGYAHRRDVLLDCLSAELASR